MPAYTKVLPDEPIFFRNNPFAGRRHSLRPVEGTRPTEPVIREETMQAACPHAAGLEKRRDHVTALITDQNFARSNFDRAFRISSPDKGELR